ncbi:DUF5694 domain-containing protein [Hymenobacter sublimis]|uniref:DUF5694 domain-containing protein n=1 Tax=Hymenobacter sublimis TaxID=2933777 RepID=A0ABY4J8C9_9BACT|nr:DUF5694 domain-containing protein [Hymenobacter sublimis]UPL48192.1 DUF5694 domain-containing protein [Hymenobacter sublimis]
MRKSLLTTLLALAAATSSYAQDYKAVVKAIANDKPKEQTQLMILGSSHFGQEGFYKGFPKADLFSEQRQQEVAQLNKQLAKFNPDVIMIETTPEEQYSVDSLYTLYKTGKVELKDIPYGRAERFQFGYQLGKTLNHNRIHSADYYEAVSNRILTSGENFELYQTDAAKFSGIGKAAEARFKEGNATLKEFLLFINDPTVLDFTYRVMFVNPARVKDGKFTNPPAQYVDTAYVNKQYIGAEYISIFHERDLKIYSNIVTTQLREKGKRILLIMGQRHAATLPKIFANDPAYKLVPVSAYVK